MPAGQCPSRNDLEAYVVGSLNTAELQVIAHHLSVCSACRAEEQRLQSDDVPLLASLFDPRWPPGYADEPACKLALAKAEAMGLEESRSEAATAEAASGKAKRKVNRLRQYQLLQRLGGGGMGDVYKARHARLERVVAIKVLSKQLKKDPDALARFHREMKVIGKLDHPHIVRATDADEDAGFHYLVMDLVEGHDLSSLVQRLGPLSVADACALMQQAADALEYIHRNGLVHRDIKPSNMMLEAKGQLKLLDLGLSLLREDEADDHNLTTTGVLMGTCDYISPEQCSDSHDVDIRADLYSLGCTLYELLCGHAPFSTPECNTRIKKVMAHLQSPVPPIRDSRPDIPQALAGIVDRLLAKNRDDRFSTPAELVAALQPFVGGSELSGLVARMQRGPLAETVSGDGDTSSQPHDPLAQTLGNKANQGVATREGSAEQLRAKDKPHPESVDPRPVVSQRAKGQRRKFLFLRWPAALSSLIAKSRKQALGSRQRILLAALVALGSFLIVLLGVVLALRTPDGTLFVEINEPGATVRVFDEQGKVEVTRQGEAGKLSIAVDPGKHRLKVEKEGFAIFTQEFTIESDRQKRVMARLEPLPSAVAAKPPARSLPPVDASPSSSPPPLAVAPFTAEEAKQYQETWAAHLGVPVEITNSVGMKLVLVPPGEFDMGSTEEEVAEYLQEARALSFPEDFSNQLPSEAPRRHVRITQPFYLGSCEVTIGAFERFVQETGYVTVVERHGTGYGRDEGGRLVRKPEFTWRNSGHQQTNGHPVVLVTLGDGLAFCRWLSGRETAEYFLPSEAQWEYGCRAGTTTRWSFGDDPSILGEYAWWKSNSSGTSHAVGQKRANDWGIYDMHGNVHEICVGWVKEEDYETSNTGSPTSEVLGDFQVARGGRWSVPFASCFRSAFRMAGSHSLPGHGGDHTGFRVGRTVESPGPEAGRAKPLPKDADAAARPAPEDQARSSTPPATVKGPPPPLAIAPFDGLVARQHQAAWAKYEGTPVEMTNSIGMTFVLIPSGAYEMGSTEQEIERALAEDRQEYPTHESYHKRMAAEGPRHHVRITKPFLLGKYLVTQGEYEKVMDINPSAFAARQVDAASFHPPIDEKQKEYRAGDAARVAGRDTGRHPVETVSWDDCVEFCRRLSATPAEQAAGRTYRLPTEAEWEYACRAGTTSRWSCGDEESCLLEYACFSKNSASMTHPVGERKPNAWGLFDMHGNVYQWCRDWFGAEYYKNSPVDDPIGPLTGSGRVQRGGVYCYGAVRCRSAMRHTSSRADIHDHANGFRVALEIAPTDQGKSSSTAVVPDTTHTRNVPPIAIAPFDTATARQHQGTWANYLGTSTVMVDSSGIRLMLIPPGEFDMGSTKQEVDRLMEKLKVQKLNDPLLDTTDGYLLPTGSPQHRVRITKAFYMGAREVTLGTFRQFVRETWHKTDAEKDGVDPAGEDDDEDLPRLKDSGHGAGRPRLTEIIDIGRRPAMVNHSVVNRTSVPKPASLASSLNLKWDA